MEKQFSFDEVNNFLKKFKEKRGKKTTAIKSQKTQIIPNKIKQEDENIFGVNNNTATDKIFGNKVSEDIFNNNKNQENNIEIIKNDIEDKQNEIFKKPKEKPAIQINEEKEDLNIFNNKKEKENDVNLFKTNEESNNENFDLFNNNANINNKNEIDDIFFKNKNEEEDLNFFNNKNNLDNYNNNANYNKKEIAFNSQPKSNNKINNIIKPKNIINNNFNNNYTNFKTGIVLNNPLENEQNQKDKENEEIFNIFQGKEDNNNNIDNYKKEENNINNNFENNNNNEIFEQKEENYISNNNIYYNVNNNLDNNINENNKEEFNNNFNEDNNNNYYEKKDSNNEMEKLDEDQNNIQSNDNNMNNYNQQVNNYKYINDKKEMDINYNQDSDLKLNYNLNEKNTSIKSYDFSSIEQNYVILSSNESKTITINNIYSMLNSNYENQLYEIYFPVSYNKEPDLNKLINLLNIILSNENESNEPLGHILAYIFKFILENKLNLEKMNILLNSELKNIILQILSKQIQKENKGTISINNLFNAETLFNQNNSNLNYDIMNEALTHPLEFMLNLFNEKILNKNNILYLYFILLNIKENEEYNHSIGLDEYDYIFENFECALFILLKYFGNDINKIKNVINILLNSYSTKISFCQFVILKCLIGDFDIKNGKKYGNIFVNFLQFPTIEKIIIADIYNFVLFTASSKFKKVIAKSSILIKYKYSLLKQNNKPENNLIILNKKVFENIHQFGSISKNSFFINHLKDFSTKKLNIKISPKTTTPSQKSEEEPNIFQKTQVNKNNNIKKAEEPQQQKGLFSAFINAFGFGGSEDNNTNNNNSNQISEEDKKRMTPSELWKLEHPGQPEIEYDPVLKRYKLRGIIYDDQEEVKTKQEMEKPMVIPPKSKKYDIKKKNISLNENNNNNTEDNNTSEINNEEDNNIYQNKNSSMSGGPGNLNNRINNPFGYSKVKNLNSSKNIQKPNNNSLSQRYAVAYKK